MSLVFQQLAQASDPGTPGPVLVALARSAPPEVQKRVASNPNTPLEALAALTERFGPEVAKNPVWSLLSLGDPGVWAALPSEAAVRLARTPMARVMVDWALSSRIQLVVWLELTCNSTFALELRRRIALSDLELLAKAFL